MVYSDELRRLGGHSPPPPDEALDAGFGASFGPCGSAVGSTAAPPPLPDVTRPGTRPTSSRPHPRYLQDSASRLAEDALRAHRDAAYRDASLHDAVLREREAAAQDSSRPSSRAWPGRGPSPFGGSTTRSETPVLGACGSRVDSPTRQVSTACCTVQAHGGSCGCAGGTTLGDAEMWRRVFMLQARECIDELRAVFEICQTGSFATRFEDWRKVDLKATAQLQQHVKQLTRLNQSVDEYLTRCATPDEFTRFKGAIVSLSTCVNDLSNMRTEMGENVDTIAARAALKVAEVWKTDAENAADLLQRSLDALEAQKLLSEKRHEMLDARLQRLTTCTEQLCTEISNQREQLHELEISGRRRAQDATSNWRETMEAMRGDAAKSTADLTQSLRREAEANLQAFQQHITDVLNGSGASDNGSQPPLGRSVASIESRLQAWEGESLKEIETLREKTRTQKEDLKDASLELGKWQKTSQEAATRLEVLEGRVAELNGELDRTRGSLEAALASSLGRALKRLKEIEGHGHVKVNRQSGAVNFVQALEFTGDAAGAIAYADAVKARALLDDFTEALNLFEVPVSIEVQVGAPKGTPLAVAEKTAELRAEFFRGELERMGVPGTRIFVKPLAIQGGADGITLQLDKAFFVGVVAGKKAPGRR